MNTNQLRYFIAVAQCRSFTKAANQFYISQTAITQQIHSLEQSMEVLLFDRTCRPIELTPAGKIFLIEAKAIIERMNTAISKVQDASVGLVGTLRIGYTKGYEGSSLSNLLRSFHSEHANILVTCHRHNTDQLAAGLLNGDYDIIFTWNGTNIIQEKNIEYQQIEKVPLTVVLYGGHPFARRASLSRKELKDEPMICMTSDNSGEPLGDKRFFSVYEKAGYYPNIIFRTSDVESILMMIAAEEGISVMPSYITDKLVNADNLVFIPLKGNDEKEEIIAAWRKDKSLPLQYFLEHFFKQLEKKTSPNS